MKTHIKRIHDVVLGPKSHQKNTLYNEPMCLPIENSSRTMSLILWSQILFRNSSENFRSDIPNPHQNLVLKSDNENSDHILSGI